MNRKIPHFSESLFYEMEQIAIYLDHHGKNFFDELSDGIINSEEFRTIDVIVCNPDICQRDLAKLIYKGTANLSRDLEKLEKRGLIKRDLETKEKRIVKTLVLTKKGLKTCEKINIKTQNHLEQMENIFTQNEHQQFIHLLEKLRNRLTESHDMIFE